MGQIPKVTANTLKRIAGVSGKQYKKVQWHTTEVIIKPLLSIGEYADVIRHIIKDCSSPDGSCAIELVDFSIRVNIISSYAFVDLPKEINDMYYIVYASDLFDLVCANVNKGQLESIIKLIYGMVGVCNG